MARDKSLRESAGDETQKAIFARDPNNDGSKVGNPPKHAESPINARNDLDRGDDLADYSPEALLSFYSAVAS